MESITIDNYDYQIKKLNIFTGLNDAGKTSIINQLIEKLCSINNKDKSSYLFLDKPEQDLHPANISSKIKQLCDFATRSDTPIFVETHNDHVINAILVYCKQTLNKFGNDVSIYHLSREYKESRTIVTIPIVEGYRLKHIPDGFFDQINIDQKYLVGF
jgi:predicted ATPase